MHLITCYCEIASDTLKGSELPESFFSLPQLVELTASHKAQLKSTLLKRLQLVCRAWGAGKAGQGPMNRLHSGAEIH
jgi:hypothetical protein